VTNPIDPDRSARYGQGSSIMPSTVVAKVGARFGGLGLGHRSLSWSGVPVSPLDRTDERAPNVGDNSLQRHGAPGLNDPAPEFLLVSA
jgi:hypothetical protein